MGTQTKYLQLYKPAKNDYYNVETDQNENFDKIDKKIEEMDKAAKEVKELADGKEDKFDKKTGFNLEKTSILEDEENKLQTAKGVLNGDLAVVGSNSLHAFPLSNATKGSIYYHKGTNRYYICINNYSGSSLTNPNANFEELSVYTNRQRLDNLRKIRYYASEILAENVTVNNSCYLTIVNDSVGLLYMDSVHIATRFQKNGYNKLINIPAEYKIIGTSDTNFKNGFGSEIGHYVRTMTTDISVYLTEYSAGQTDLIGSYLSIVFLLKRVSS